MPHHTIPAEAWRALRDGNERFVAGTMEHPSQDADRRADVRTGQQPFAVLLGCSDSRVAAEIIFDRGLGDLFVVRTAGHVSDATVLGSVEYGVAVLGVPLVVVLGHDSCGAIAATLESIRTGVQPPGHIRSIVDRVRPSVVEHVDAPADEVLTEHVRYTVRTLLEDSVAVRAAVAEGRCAVVGTTYELAEGRVRVVAAHGPVDALDAHVETTARPDGSI
ncbi:carbonic anhydrase [Actinotalea fermentans]|uniref:carbonic anhydrase n=1 Tax=Actinotalea fermentans TaxID=43671 RepID=A0A511YWU4_9CELL|nr:carbonic anhydrase [Actinotalea fermentans]GEN79658.1 carbonic anhydrase [Actinotalea fermentans]